MNSLFKAAQQAVFSALPSSVSPANGYARSFGALMCLAVSADLEFETEEFQQASMYTERDSLLRRDGTTTSSISYFKGYCDTIKKVMRQDNLDFPSVQTEMIAEVRKCPEEYKATLRAVIADLRPKGGPAENAIFDRIDL